MLIALMIWFLRHHLPLCEAGFALVYASLAALSWNHLPHAFAYAVAAVLAVALAACAMMAS